jgi:exosortase/archaeosortase family protein
MNSIFALPAIGIFYAFEFVPESSPVRKLILVLSTVPIAIMANIMRVLALVLGAYYFGVDRIEGLFHDATGIALWMCALVLLFLFDRVVTGFGFLFRYPLGDRNRLRRAG